MKLSFKFVGGSLLATAVVTGLGVCGVSAEKDYIKVNTDFSTFSFGGVEFSSLDDLIEYLKKLISDLFVACKLSPENNSLLERLGKAKNALDEAQKLKTRAKSIKNNVLKKLEKLRENSRKKDDNMSFDIEWKNREDVRAYEEELWKKAHSEGRYSIDIDSQYIFDEIVIKSGFFNYVFRVEDFSNNKTIVYKEFAHLNLNNDGLELVFSGGGSVGRREFVNFLEEDSEKKIENLFNKIRLLDYICNDSADKLGYGRKREFYVDSADEKGFEFKRYGSSSTTFKIDEKSWKAAINFGNDGEEKEFDMTKLDDLEALNSEMEKCIKEEQKESSSNLVNDNEDEVQYFDYDPSCVVLE